MTGPPAALAAVRSALREALTAHGLIGQRVIVACSGGADSLALALAASFVVDRDGGGEARAVIVDHQLQPGSADVADVAAEQCRDVGLEARVVPVRVVTSATGPEDAARSARYAALSSAARQWGAAAVLVAHTRNDQAEQVLLGLSRGSGARSLSGMPAARPLIVPHPQRVQGHMGRSDQEPSAVLLVRPFLTLDRVTTVAACADAGLRPWQDPHNADRGFARVRARSVLDILETELGPGVTAALSRSAGLLRADADALDHLSESAYQAMGPAPWAVEPLAAHPEAVRTRVLRRAALEAGCPAGSLRAEHVFAMDGLCARWRGQGPIDLPGHLQMRRSDGRIWLEPSKPS